MEALSSQPSSVKKKRSTPQPLVPIPTGSFVKWEDKQGKWNTGQVVLQQSAKKYMVQQMTMKSATVELKDFDVASIIRIGERYSCNINGSKIHCQVKKEMPTGWEVQWSKKGATNYIPLSKLQLFPEKRTTPEKDNKKRKREPGTAPVPRKRLRQATPVTSLTPSGGMKPRKFLGTPTGRTQILNQFATPTPKPKTRTPMNAEIEALRAKCKYLEKQKQNLAKEKDNREKYWKAKLKLVREEYDKSETQRKKELEDIMELYEKQEQTISEGFQKKIIEVEEARQELERQVEAYQAQQEELQKQLEIVKGEKKKIEGDYESLEESRQAAKERLKDYEKTIDSQKNTITDLEEKNTTKEGRIASIEKLVNSQKKTIKGLEKQISSKERRLSSVEKLKKEKSELQVGYKALEQRYKDEIAVLKTDIKQHEKTVQSQSNEMARIESAKMKAEEDVNNWKEKHTKMSNDLDASKTKMTLMKSESAHLKKSNTKRKKTIQKLTKENADYKKQSEAHSKKMVNLQTQLDSNSKQVEEVTKQLEEQRIATSQAEELLAKERRSIKKRETQRKSFATKDCCA